MRSSGIVKESVGNAIVVNSLGEETRLSAGDILNIGDTVRTSFSSDKLVISFGLNDVILTGEDSLKIDQSVIITQSFGEESNLQLDSIQKAILEIQNFESSEETATSLLSNDDNDEYGSTVTQVAKDDIHEDKTEIYSGLDSSKSDFEDKSNFSKYSDEIKKFNLDMLNTGSDELDIKAVVTSAKNNGYSIASIADDATLDLSKVGNLDKAMRSVAKTEFDDSSKLGNVSTKDMLDINDKQEENVIKIDSRNGESASASDTPKDDSLSFKNNDKYEKFDTATESGNTVSIKIENDLQVDI